MKTKILIVALLVVVLTVCLCVPVFAYADTSSEIVNFNQLFSLTIGAFTSVSSLSNECTLVISGDNSTAGNLAYTTGITFDSSHYYYFKMPEFVHLLSATGSGVVNVGGEFVGSGYSGTATRIYYHSSYGTWATGTYYFVCIDLTQMFGEDTASSMSLSDCQEIFVADYYAYNTGTSISLNGLNSYAQGVSDALDSLTVHYNADIIGSLGYGYTYDGYVGEFYYNSEFGAYYFNYFFALPVGSIPSSSQITIYTQFLSGSDLYYQVYYKLNDSLVLASSELIQYQTYEDYDNELSAINVFSIPYVVDTLYFCVSSNASSYSGITSNYALRSDMTFKTLDVSTLVSAAYSNGAQYYKNYYSENAEGYNVIYDAGYSAGLEAETPYTFGYLMSSVIEAPLNAVLGIFNFDFLGVNFQDMITLVITLCIIIAIVRLFMGGRE